MNESMVSVEASAALHAELDAILHDVRRKDAVSADRLWQFFGALFGDVISDDLRQRALTAMGQPPPSMNESAMKMAQRRFHQHLLIELIHSARPVLPAEFNGGAVVFDLLQPLLPDGDAPQALLPWSSDRDHKRLKRTARKAFVQGVFYRAAQAGIANALLLRRVGVAMEDDAWRQWKKAVSIADRELATKAGKSGKEWQRAVDDAELKRLYRMGVGRGLR